jgi:hypothetical protein
MCRFLFSSGSNESHLSLARNDAQQNGGHPNDINQNDIKQDDGHQNGSKQKDIRQNEAV